MKTQLSRDSHDAAKRYSGVYQQQGRMLTDDDWNVLAKIVKERLDGALRDVIGSGSPRPRGIVRITPQPDGTEAVELRWGQVYVDGIPAQVRPDPAASAVGVAFDYTKQADFPDPPPRPTGAHRLYLDVWERAVTALEDPDLRDAGLHGADTCTRCQTMAQVKWCPVGVDPEAALDNPPKGDAPLTLDLRQGSSEPDPCDPCADELQLQERVGNYLFRVEVHDVVLDAGGNIQQLTLKWSSENGAEHYKIGAGPPGFQSDDWVYEFYSGASEQFASEKHLGIHLADDPGWSPTRGTLTEGYPATPPSSQSLVRRWDGYCVLNHNGGWSLAAGSDRGVALATASSADAHGHVALSAGVTINLDAIDLALQLDSQVFVAGDYWCAAVREAQHKSGDNLLNAVPPKGIEHHYMTLVDVADDGTLTWYYGAQCKRGEFPPLTDLRAKDVCFDNAQCELPDAKTVQDALDRLCQERDLRFHNKHLHGWGIVCGLAVECGPDVAVDDATTPQRRRVTVQKGYAIDCEGNDVLLEQAATLDLIERIQKHEEATGEKLLDDGDGSLCLTVALDENGEPDYAIEAYTADDTSLKTLLQGTLLMDFYNDCIKDVIDAIREEVSFEEDEDIKGPLVSAQRRRLIALLNLIVQLFNSANGSYVFLSPKEHKILRDLYLRLREILQSKTFCAMFAGDDFPDYPFPNTGMTTLFGKNGHTQLIAHPNGERIYSYGGTNNQINVYEAKTEELIEVVEMPAGEGAEIQAVAFSQDGAQLFAVALIRGVDSVFGVADLANDQHTWRKMVVLCDLALNRLVTSTRDDGLLYAIGQGKGLYYLRPAILLDQTKPEPQPAYGFNAVGQLAVDEQRGRAFATANAKGADSNRYDRVVMLDITKVPDEDEGQPADPTATIALPKLKEQPLSGDDDMTIGQVNANGSGARLYVITDPASGETQKHLLTFDLENFETGATPEFNVLNVEDTTIRLAFHVPSRRLLLTFEDGYRAQLVEATGVKTLAQRIPVQISPIAITASIKGEQIYVLNYISNTLSRIPADELEVNDAFLDALADYRSEVLEAFYGLFGNLLQYLKDCFCHHLLVKCPTCDADDKLYLACIEIRANQVYRICNFSKRKYVKTFPTVGYWLSLIPIAPYIKLAVERICCSILPNLFEQEKARVLPAKPQPGAGAQVAADNRIQSQPTRRALQTYQRTDFQAVMQDQRKNLDVLGRLTLDSTRYRVETSSLREPGVNRAVLLNTRVEEARAHLEKNNITVERVETYDRAKGGANLMAFGRTPLRIAPGAKVTLYEENGKVLFYALSQETEVSGVSDEVKAEIDALERRKAALRDTAEIKAELARIETRRAEAANVTAIRTDINALTEERTVVQREVVTLKEELAALQSNLQEVAKLRRELSLAVARDRPVKDVEGITEEIDNHLREVGIRTVGELANADVRVISRAGSPLKEVQAKALIANARKRLEIQ